MSRDSIQFHMVSYCSAIKTQHSSYPIHLPYSADKASLGTINTFKLRKSGQKILKSEARQGGDFQYFWVLITCEEVRSLAVVNPTLY